MKLYVNASTTPEVTISIVATAYRHRETPMFSFFARFVFSSSAGEAEGDEFSEDSPPIDSYSSSTASAIVTEASCSLKYGRKEQEGSAVTFQNGMKWFGQLVGQPEMTLKGILGA